MALPFSNTVDRTLERLRTAFVETARGAREVVGAPLRPDLPDDDIPRLKSRIAACLAGNAQALELTDDLQINGYLDLRAVAPADPQSWLHGGLGKFRYGGMQKFGTEGVMLLPHFSLPALFPQAKFKDFKFPHVQGLKHWEQFVEACRGNDKTTADFAYAGPLTETILLGDIAARFPDTTLEWHSRKMNFNLPEANQYVRRKYRARWEVEGL